MHPYYQDFFLDDPMLDTVYRLVEKYNLMLVMHTGYDIAFPQDRRADPERIRRVLERFADLKLITTHLGAWNLWNEVRELLTGQPIYMELSFSLQFLDHVQLRDIIENHPPGYILFGTDSPWADQQTALHLLENLGLDQELFSRIVEKNAQALLNQVNS